MDRQQSPIQWSFSCGTIARTDLRISWFLPLLFVLVCVRLNDFALGITFSLIYLASVFLHEFGHIAAVRSTGGTGNEILLWPLGGLAAVAPANSFKSRLLTPLAGPLVNAAICLLTLLPAIQSQHGTAIFYPLAIPPVELSIEPLTTALVLAFWINWILLLINLIPVHPFDGGRILQAVLSEKWSNEIAISTYLKIGCAVGFIGFIGGMMADSTWIVAISAFVLLMNLQESFQHQSGEYSQESTSFMGYDFSQGYTSLERENESAETNKPPGMLQRWREKRQQEKERMINEQNANLQQQLDQLLEKIQRNGLESLSDTERQQLDHVSEILREKGKTSE